jgi:hypothetical protein
MGFFVELVCHGPRFYRAGSIVFEALEADLLPTTTIVKPLRRNADLS